MSTVEHIRNAFGMTEEAAQTLFNRPVGMIADMPLAIENGYLLAEKLEEQAEMVQPLEDVRAQVEDMLKEQKAKELAQQLAQEILARLQDPEQAGQVLQDLEVKTSEPFGRRGFIPELGRSPQLAAAAFDAQEGVWLDQPFEVSSGYLIARLDHVVPAADEEWTEQKERWTQALTEQQQQEVYAAFLSQLRSEAKIEVTQPRLIQ